MGEFCFYLWIEEGELMVEYYYQPTKDQHQHPISMVVVYYSVTYGITLGIDEDAF